VFSENTAIAFKQTTYPKHSNEQHQILNPKEYQQTTTLETKKLAPQTKNCIP